VATRSALRKRRDQYQRGEFLVAQNHYTTKTKRRNKNKDRKDPSQATMAALRKSAAAETKKSTK
jgi:hypothetical protein